MKCVELPQLMVEKSVLGAVPAPICKFINPPASVVLECVST
jgi:hypothetical protein